MNKRMNEGYRSELERAENFNRRDSCEPARGTGDALF